MKISTKGRYALRLMLDLALHEQSGYVPIVHQRNKDEEDTTDMCLSK